MLIVVYNICPYFSTGCLEEVCRLTWSGCVQPLAAAECPWNAQVWVCATGSQYVTHVNKFLCLNHEFLNQDSFARKVWVCAKGSQIVLPVEKFLSLKREFGL